MEHNSELKVEIKKLIQNTIGTNFHVEVFNSRSFYKKVPNVGILIASSSYEINNVKNQFPQAVSLLLDTETMKLDIQVFGGNGGNRIYLQPDSNNPKEKYLAMVGLKIPFRKPKKEIKFVLKAIENFAQRYKQALIDNNERLMYRDKVDYDSILS